MTRLVLRLALDVVLTVGLALLLLGVWQWFLGGGSAGDGFAEGVRVLFNFMDVGLLLWVVLLVIAALRRRAGAGSVYLLLLIGTVVNAVVVLVVGFIQGGAGAWLVMFAISAGLACLVAAAIVVPIVHRLLGRG